MRWSGPWTIVGRTLVANRLLAGSACGKRQRGWPLNSVVRAQLATVEASPKIDGTARAWRFTFGAGFIGLIAATIYAGPHFREWSLLSSVLVILAAGSAGAILGGVWAHLVAAGKKNSTPFDGAGPRTFGAYSRLGDSGGGPPPFRGGGCRGGGAGGRGGKGNLPPTKG